MSDLAAAAAGPGRPRRLALVGCGFIGGVHSMALRGLFQAGVIAEEVVATCDADVGRAELYAAAHGARVATSDADEAMGSADAVWIATPTATHADLVTRAAARGLAVYCEKPLAPSLADSESLAAVVRAANISVQVGLVLRHSTVLGALAAEIRSGVIGRPMAAALRDDQYFPIQGQYGSTWRADVATAGGGTLIEHSIHDIDALSWLLGSVTDVTARITNFAGHPGIEDVAVATLSHQGGATSTLTSVWHSILSRPSTRRLEVICERGVLWTEDEHTGPAWMQTDAGTVDLPCGPEPERAAVIDRVCRALDLPAEWCGPLSTYVLADLAFVEALRKGTAPFPDLGTALDAHRVVDTMYRSAAEAGAAARPGEAPGASDHSE